MCGIVGFWKPGGLDASESTILKEMTAMLHHRGPDGSGHHVDLPLGLAMGHARLAIIDLHSGQQPILYGDGENKAIITVNGEFYDYRRTRTRLQLEGFGFTSQSDSEIAPPLYIKHGLGFVEHLRGEFAFAMFDTRRRRLLLVRDRFGIKPLYYHVNSKGIYWASEMKSFLPHPDIELKMEGQGVLHQLMFQTVPGKTLFEGIYTLNPGHMLIIEEADGHLKVHDRKYWDMDFPDSGFYDQGRTSQYYIESIREQLTHSVELRLEADVPVGCYLSGGLDSSIIVGLASAIKQSPVSTYNLSFDQEGFDESALARLMAAHAQANHHTIPIAAAELYGNNYLKTLWHGERTFYNTLGTAKLQLSKKVKESGYSVVITGEGSDEMFGGYLQFKLDLLRYHNWDKNSRSPLNSTAHNQLYQHLSDKFSKRYLTDNVYSHPAFNDIIGFTPSWLEPWITNLAYIKPLLHDDLLHELDGYDPVETIAQSLDADQLKGRNALDIAQYTWIKIMLEGNILSWGGDRVDMAHSIESRPAFLDHKVAEMAREIPPWFKINGTTEKWALRESFKEILPKALSKRPKFPFRSPFAFTNTQKSEALDRLKSEFLNDQALKEAGIFDKKRVSKFLKAHKEDKNRESLRRKDAFFNYIIGLQVLHQQFCQKKGLSQ